MKKIHIIIALVLLGNFAMAQTSVWQGGREMWTRGEGTEDSPFLIENAEQLAMLSYVVNKGYVMHDLYFKLTTDIDLNGSEDQPWTPIGSAYYFEDGCERRTEFAEYYFNGNFDGDGHAVSNIFVDSKSYAGLFGLVHAYDTLPISIKNIRIASGYISGSSAGGVVGFAYGDVIISKCYNVAEIHGSETGGISGQNGIFERCSNTGKVSATNKAGGITSMSGSIIKECYNSGEIVSEGVIAGGVVGVCSSLRSAIENCYNTGMVTVLNPEVVSSSGCGGIIGFAIPNREVTLHNCYNVGSINGIEGHSGGITGCEIEADSVRNCYYLNTCGVQGLGIAMDEDAMRTPDFVATLNDNTDVWAMDVENHNFGFPILNGLDMAVNEVRGDDLAVYPNPTQGTLRIESGHIEQIEVFNMLGVKVMQCNLHCYDGTATLDVSTLTDGLYLLRVTDSQKVYHSCSFVVRH